MREVYIKKPNGRYESLGWDWTGFPADGIWLVQDGTNNCLIQLSNICTKPHRYLELVQHKEACTKYIIDKAQTDKGFSYSLNDLAEWAAEFYADKLGADNE